MSASSGSDRDFDTLMTTLEVAVPMHLFEQQHWTNERRMAESADAATVIGSHGDALQFGGKHCALAFNRLARGIALLAAAPGGITFRGRHWCLAPHTGCVNTKPGSS